MFSSALVALDLSPPASAKPPGARRPVLMVPDPETENA